MNNISKTIIVLGSPRSGTSLTSGILDILGIDMGNVRRPDAQNPTGYYEDIEISRLCDSIIQDISPDMNGFNLPLRKDILERRDKFKVRIKKLLNEKFSRRGLHGWKTITTAVLFDLFIPFVNEPHLIVVFRNPLDTAKSIVNYTDYKEMYQPLTEAQSLEVVARYYSELARILNDYNDIPSLLISYEALINNPAEYAEKIGVFLDLEIAETQVNAVKNKIQSRRTMERLKSRNSIKDKIRSTASRLKYLIFH